jgi:hypothetical protein
VLVCITILCALALGYVVALLTGSAVTSSQATNLPSAAATLAETATSGPSEALASPAPEQTTAAASSPPPATARPTPRPAPTPTPEVKTFVVENFESTTNGFLTRETSTSSAGVVDGQYRLKLAGQQNIGFTTPLPASDYRLSFDLSVQQGGAGLVFLVAPPATTYRLLITPDGAFALERQDEAAATQLLSWTESAALRTGSEAVNRLQIERRGNQMRFFANDELLTDYTIPEGEFENRYGFVLASRSGQGQALFDNLRGELLSGS